MLEIQELNQSWDEEIPYFNEASVLDFSSEAPLWDGLDQYLGEVCVAVLE